jgi:hypothetical protein
MIIMPFVGKFMGRKFAYWSESIGHGVTRPQLEELLLTAGCSAGWARYMEWMHNVEIRWTNKRVFNAAGAAEAAVSL